MCFIYSDKGTILAHWRRKTIVPEAEPSIAKYSETVFLGVKPYLSESVFGLLKHGHKAGGELKYSPQIIIKLFKLQSGEARS